MNRIVITGSFATGKTTVSLVLSHLTGFLHLLPKSDYETAKTLIVYNDDPDQFYIYFMNCLLKLSDRLKNESLAESCFVSDGCLLNEVAYLKAFHEISNQSFANTKKIKEQSLMIQSIENSVSYYFRKRYDEIIFLNMCNDSIPELSAIPHQFRTLYDSYLKEMLSKSGQPYSTYIVDDLELVINQIVEEKRFERRMSVKEAIYKTQVNLHRVHTPLNRAELN